MLGLVGALGFDVVENSDDGREGAFPTVEGWMPLSRGRGGVQTLDLFTGSKSKGNRQ